MRGCGNRGAAGSYLKQNYEMLAERARGLLSGDASRPDGSSASRGSKAAKGETVSSRRQRIIRAGSRAVRFSRRKTIDHLVQDVYKPKPPDERHAPHSPTTSTGLRVEDQVHKEWDPRKVGLPTF